jgi:hypothetical protein
MKLRVTAEAIIDLATGKPIDKPVGFEDGTEIEAEELNGHLKITGVFGVGTTRPPWPGAPTEAVTNQTGRMALAWQHAMEQKRKRLNQRGPMWLNRARILMRDGKLPDDEPQTYNSQKSVVYQNAIKACREALAYNALAEEFGLSLVDWVVPPEEEISQIGKRSPAPAATVSSA